MRVINNYEDFVEYIKRSLGEPVIRVNVDYEQIEDRVYEALEYFQEYHHDATENVIIGHAVTQEDKDRGYLIAPRNVIGVKELYYDMNPTSVYGWQSIYIRELWEKARSMDGGLSSYLRMESEIAQLESLFSQKLNWQFNKNTKRLHIQFDWSLVSVGDIIVFESVSIVNPDESPEIWNDMWLKRYCVELVRYQWGQNLSKFTNVELPGGMSLNGEQIKQEAFENLERMREEMLSKYSFASNIYLG